MLCQLSKYGKFYQLDRFFLLFFKLIEVLYSKEMKDEELSFTLFPFGHQHVHNTTFSFLTAIMKENHKPYGPKP